MRLHRTASAVLATAEFFDSTGKTITQAALIDNLITGRSLHSATLLDDSAHNINDKVLVVGGMDAMGNPLASAELYDPVAKTWTPTG